MSIKAIAICFFRLLNQSPLRIDMLQYCAKVPSVFVIEPYSLSHSRQVQLMTLLQRSLFTYIFVYKQSVTKMLLFLSLQRLQKIQKTTMQWLEV